MLQSTIQHRAEQSGYSLDFLRADEAEFKSVMVDYIKNNFSDLLGEEDMKLLQSGDPAALEALSRRCMQRYFSRRN
ncbi:MAG: hypothetical protein A2583_10795 [Bdellovibrionales bacterium RIFOXYD1_FULL_53_11]|nr:MAG: hypothetical protein A2583_10795 [Bdellovibrionales bacterium RIFOXYD1_FULL_53_11]